MFTYNRLSLYRLAHDLAIHTRHTTSIPPLSLDDHPYMYVYVACTISIAQAYRARETVERVAYPRL